MQTYAILNPILSRRYGASKKARDYYYVLTVFKEPPDRTGPGLVKLNVVTGKEENRLHFSVAHGRRVANGRSPRGGQGVFGTSHTSICITG